MKLNEIKEGDFVIYTELPYSGYANSLNQAVWHKGKLTPLPLCTAWHNDYIPLAPNEIEKSIPFNQYFDENCWLPATGYTEDMDACEYMDEQMPL